MLGVCLAPGDVAPEWDYVEIQFEKSVSYDPEWKHSGPRFGVHAPYYVTLTSPKLQKVDDAINRILGAAEVARKLNADIVVTRAGFYSKQEPGEAMEALARNCREIMKKTSVPLGIETQPRQSQVGSLDDVLELAEQVGIVPVVNLPAIVQREGEIAIERVLGLVEKPYIHFDESIDLGELAAALPQKYTLVAETVKAAERMRELI
ncbi:MAG: TIM barrel protein [Candidatus Diapherotrites archaeon]|nr:TIM barrel protein [Candidatus Diapherotrites archaeon]